MTRFPHRIFFRSRFFDRQPMSTKEIEEHFIYDDKYFEIRDNYRFDEITRDDLLGKFGRMWEARKKLIAYCQSNCNRDLCAFINNKYEPGVGQKIKKVTTRKIHQMHFKRETLKDFVWEELKESMLRPEIMLCQDKAWLN